MIYKTEKSTKSVDPTYDFVQQYHNWDALGIFFYIHSKESLLKTLLSGTVISTDTKNSQCIQQIFDEQYDKANLYIAGHSTWFPVEHCAIGFITFPPYINDSLKPVGRAK